MATTDSKLDPALFAGHSLRFGFVTSAAEAGASVFKMMEVSRHKSVDTLSGYVWRADCSTRAAFLPRGNMHPIDTHDAQR